jgi:pantoate--beta-alanine ligase
VILFKNPIGLKQFLAHKSGLGFSIGFVPTMGALHDGHLSLVEEAKQKCDIVVASIFVNPTQFNNAKDLETYPRTIESDIYKLNEVGCDILFHPEVSEIYNDFNKPTSTQNYGEFIGLLEGEKRPGHFDGVATILTKLFHLVNPHQVFFGQKDFQQCMVVSELIKRDFPHIIMNRCPIKRELDGLAMSSRNVRLNISEREIAPKIYQVLMHIEQNWQPEQWEEALTYAKAALNELPFSLDYLAVCDEETLLPITSYKKPVVVLVAVYLGETRLIDNLIIN